MQSATTTLAATLPRLPRLSSAMLLGASTCRMLVGDWNSCALGAAANAIGIPAARTASGVMDDPLQVICAAETPLSRHRLIMDAWPWLKTRITQVTVMSVMNKIQYPPLAEGPRCAVWTYWREITALFDNRVVYGFMTYEQLVDWVRSVEPDCDCMRFGCDCKERAEPEREQVTVQVVQEQAQVHEQELIPS